MFHNCKGESLFQDAVNISPKQFISKPSPDIHFMGDSVFKSHINILPSNIIF